ncbi:hypothetical protein IFM89_026795 [Coptis chinensis]|uniref:Gamma tubulin complex component C-terminal domain-containing protein n=1 Tax=Coptis chinensis TaxID=261450 RepID=A0A835LJJ5_9MAGN|nr:hypothetical protein IFM89_026795 [Coptis chinensis]
MISHARLSQVFKPPSSVKPSRTKMEMNQVICHEAFTHVEGQKKFIQIDQNDLFPYLLVNIGSGVSIIKVDGDENYERINGTNVGTREAFNEMQESLLELALRTIAAAADPCHKDLTCCVERSSLLKRLSTLKDLDVNRLVSDSNGLEELISVIGLETFSLFYKVLEPNWHVMHCKLQIAKSIDEVIRCHDFFLEKCLKECPLLLPSKFSRSVM